MKRLTFLFLLLCALAKPMFAQITSVWSGVTPNIPDTVGCVEMHAVDDQVAWAVSQRYAVLDSFFDRPDRLSFWWMKTVDGGLSWQGDTAPNIGGETFIMNVMALDSSTAWVNGVDFNTFITFCFQTNDGGQTWNRILDTLFNTPGGYLNSVHFWDHQNGISMGDPSHGKNDTLFSFEIHHTTDSGKTWTRLDRANLPDPQPNEYGSSYGTFGDGVWFVTTNGRVFRSADRGHTWAVTETGYLGVLSGISFADSQVGVFGGYDWPNSSIGLFITTDGGATWEDKTPLDSAYLVTGLDIVPGTRVIVLDVRNSNTVGPFYTWASYNLGASWVQIGTGENAGWGDFVDENTGYAGEWMNLSRKGKMYSYNGSPLLGLFSNRELEASVQLSPNPARDYAELRVEAPSPRRFQLNINDLQGRLVYQSNSENTAFWSTRIDLSNLPAGIYNLTISDAKGHSTRRLVKQ